MSVLILLFDDLGITRLLLSASASGADCVSSNFFLLSSLHEMKQSLLPLAFPGEFQSIVPAFKAVLCDVY